MRLLAACGACVQAQESLLHRLDDTRAVSATATVMFHAKLDQLATAIREANRRLRPPVNRA